jgi:hypothetical protein
VCLSQEFPLICPSPVDVYLLTEAVKCLVNGESGEMLDKGVMALFKVIGLPQPLTWGLGAGAEAKYTNSTLNSAVYIGVLLF